MLGPWIKVNWQKMARVNIDILRISELKWMAVGKFNSDDHYIYNCGQESHGRNGIALMVNRRVWNAVLGRNLKNDRMISVCFQGKPFNITEIQDFVPTTDAERSWSWSILWRSRRPARTNTKKRCPFHDRGLECKSRRSRITWGNKQTWPWRTKWSRAKANWILPRECTGHSKYPFSTTQETTLHMDIIKWSISKSNWLHSL